MIEIRKSKTADSRTCDYSNVTKEDLAASSLQHIHDVELGIQFFIEKLEDAMIRHDFDKLSGISHFYNDFITGFEKTGWWENHKKINRHHLGTDGVVPDDVNLVDVLEMIVDCVMAGLGRSGSVYPLEIDPEVLMRAFKNTAKLLEDNVVVKD